MNRFDVKRFILITLLGVLFCILPLASWAQNLQIHYINVQQGQSTLIVGPNGTTILFDGGAETKGNTRVVPYLKSIGIDTNKSLDYIIASHRDTDHYLGLTEAMKAGYNALKVYDNGSPKTNTFVQDFLDTATRTTAGKSEPITLGQVIDLGYGAKATCVAVNGSVIGVGQITGATDENDRSIALLIQYGNFDYIVTGDMGGGADDTSCTLRSTSQVNVETPLAQAIMPGGAHPMLTAYGLEVAHIGHHGSESSGNSDYMNLFTPAIACVSVGDGQSSNWYHPRTAVIDNVFLAKSPCITAPPALVFQTEEGNPAGAKTSYSGYCVGDFIIATNGIDSYSITATGNISQGPDERSVAGLPLNLLFDENGNVNPSLNIYSIHTENVTTTSSDIVWTTNIAANSVLKYGTSSGSYTKTVNKTALEVTHRLSMTDLNAGTTYYYIVESTDASNKTITSSERSFTTTAAPNSAKVVFSEIYYDTIGTDAVEEWFELYNGSDSIVDIGGWTVTDNNGLGVTCTIPTGKTMRPRSYITIAVNKAGFNNIYKFDADTYINVPPLNNDGDALLLKDKTGTLVDTVAWEGGAKGGIPANWGSKSAPYANLGNTIVRKDVNVDTDTYADWGYATNNGHPHLQYLPGKILFSEVFYNTPNDNTTESWIELYNNSDFAVDMKGWTITNNNGTGTSFTFPANQVIQPGGYYTVATDKDSFRNLYHYNADLFASIPTIQVTGDALVLKEETGYIKDAVAWKAGGSAGVPAGWGSTTNPDAPLGSSILRTVSTVDTNTAADWTTAGNNGNPQTQGDIVAPVISNVLSTSVTVHEAVIIWNTDENATSRVEYGTSSGNYSNVMIIDGMTTGHVVDLSKLERATTYYYRVVSVDASENETYSSESTFTTQDTMSNTLTLTESWQGADVYAKAQITVKNPDGLPVEGANVTVSWSGSVSGTDTALTDANGIAYFTSAPANPIRWIFNITVTNVSKDGYSWDSTTSQLNASIKDVTPPVISNVQTASVSVNNAAISWNTNENAYTKIQFGTTPGNYSQTVSMDTYGMTGTLTLSNLTKATTYYYRVVSVDLSDNESVSPEYSFQTLNVMINTITLTDLKITNDVYAVAEVLVKTPEGTPVAGAIVNYAWSGSSTLTGQAVTDTKGVARFRSTSSHPNKWTFILTITNINAMGYYWDSNASQLTDNITKFKHK